MRDIFDLVRKFELLPEASVALVQDFCSTWGVSGYHGLLETNVLSEVELADKLACCLQMDRVYSLHLDSKLNVLCEELPFRTAYDWECLVIEAPNSEGHLEAVFADPTRRDRIQELRTKVSRNLTLAVGERGDILRAIVDHYSTEAQLAGEAEA